FNMARPLRIEFKGALYHILSRGNERRDIFLGDDDYQTFLDVLKEMSERFEVDIFAYVLMSNHYHLLIRTNQPNLSKSMQWVGTTYTRRFNLKHFRSGHLFQGRFKSFIIQKDNYLLTALRYVEGNPVRAGLVSSARNWLWSSHVERIGIEFHQIVDKIPIELPQKWGRYVDEPLTDKELEELHRSVNRQSPFGDTEWQGQVCRSFGLEHTIRPRGRPRKKR
ncbi:hypothetical protein LCGC14_2956080, partial [marine sediment metagenome]